MDCRGPCGVHLGVSKLNCSAVRRSEEFGAPKSFVPLRFLLRSPPLAARLVAVAAAAVLLPCCTQTARPLNMEGRPQRQRGPLPVAALTGLATGLGAGIRATCPVLVVLAVQVVSPGRVWPWVRLAASLAHRRLNWRQAAVAATPTPLQPAANALITLPAFILEPLAGPALFFVLAPPLLNRLAAPLVRTAVFYRHLLPVVVAYLRTLFFVAPGVLRRTGSEEEAQAVWDSTHEWGALRVNAMLHDLSGARLCIACSQALLTDVIPRPASHPHQAST